MRWVGLDLHKRYITACALDDEGHVVAEHRRLPADVVPLIAWLQALGDAVTVAMEATLYWAWLHDQLSAAGIAAVAAHPYQVKLIWQARCKTDPIDARKLADLVRTNLLPAIWVPDPEVRARRKLLRGRAYLVRLRTSLKNRIHGHLSAENCRTAVTDLYGRAGRTWLQTIALSPMGRLQVDLLLELVDAMDERIGRLDDRVKRLVKDDPVAQRLQSWPGIGTFGAALLRLADNVAKVTFNATGLPAPYDHNAGWRIGPNLHALLSLDPDPALRARAWAAFSCERFA